MDTSKIHRRISKIRKLIEQNHYRLAVIDCMSFIENLLRFIYQKSFTSLDIEKKKKIIDYEEKKRKSIHKMGLGELIGLLREGDMLKCHANLFKNSFFYLNYNSLSLLTKIRNIYTHSDEECSINEVMFVFYNFLLILEELGLYDIDEQEEFLDIIYTGAEEDIKDDHIDIEPDALEDGQEYLDELNAEAYKLAYDNKKEESIAILDKLVELAPNYGDYYDSYGEILMIFKEYQRAIQKLEKAIELAPDGYFLHQTYIKIGNCYKELKNYDQALENIEIGKKLAEEHLKEEWIELADKYFKEIKQKDEELFKKYIERLNSNAYELARNDKKQEAVDTIKKLLRIAPDIGSYHDTYGELLLMFGEYQEAINSFKQAIKVDPNGWFLYETYIKMGKCYAELGLYQQGLENIEMGKIKAEKNNEDEWVKIAHEYEEDINTKMVGKPGISKNAILNVLNNDWQPITSIIFTMKIKEMMEARSLQNKLKDLEKKGDILVEIKKGKKHWRLP